MLKACVHHGPGGRVLLVDSITLVTADDAGSLVVAASHGGSSSAVFALEVPLALVVFNDAGVGKDEAGVAALALLEAHGVACAAVAHTSARIGDAMDMWQHGVIARVNARARSLGLDAGQALGESLRRLAG